MKISRELAIKILKYLYENPDFKFPFVVVCLEYTPEDDDFVEIMPEEWQIIFEDSGYKTFQLWHRFKDMEDYSINLLSKWYLEKILQKSLKNELYNLFNFYNQLYDEELLLSKDIQKFWENEFFGWKKEAFEDALEVLKKLDIN